MKISLSHIRLNLEILDGYYHTPVTVTIDHSNVLTQVMLTFTQFPDAGVM